METRHGIKYRQLHIEDYLQEIPAEQRGVKIPKEEKGKVRKLEIPMVSS